MNRAAYKIGLAIAWAVEHAKAPVTVSTDDRRALFLVGESTAVLLLSEVEAGNVDPTDVLADLVADAKER